MSGYGVRQYGIAGYGDPTPVYAAIVAETVRAVPQITADYIKVVPQITAEEIDVTS